MPITITRGDITVVEADAIVNAANSLLLPGGGVCGAIHAAVGLELSAACVAWVSAHGPVKPGGAAITPGFHLPAHFVIHAVGPIWSGGRANEPELLASAYRRSIELAEENGLATVAFPSISTGIYGYPITLAAPVALRAIAEGLQHAPHVREVTMVLFDARTLAAFEQAAADPGNPPFA